jgi:3'-phosphoadenosine 5'-phosphosulfate sulfotransferase (PAPS reductase)/FAD synthetase
MSKATDIIKRVAEQTDRILLFHSATGKDSIAMLDLCAPYFKEIVCVYMWVVPNLTSTTRYIKWAEATYPNASFLRTKSGYGVPHFNVSSYKKYGYLGCKADPKQKLHNLVSVTDIARERTGIQYACYGMKEADSLQRRVFLRTYDAMCFQSVEGANIAVDVAKGEVVVDTTVFKAEDLVSMAEAVRAGGLTATADRFDKMIGNKKIPLNVDVLARLGFYKTDGICWKTKKFYPLHLYKHKDIEKYIAEKHLITNVDYGEGIFQKATSSGESVDSPVFLNYLRNNFPTDLQRVYAYYPDAERILFEFDAMMAAQGVQLTAE